MPTFDNVVGSTSMQPWWDATGRQWLKVKYTNDGVLNTPMIVIPGVSGYTAVDIADNTQVYYLGVPNNTYATNAEGPIQIGGIVVSMIVASTSLSASGGIKVHDGAVVTTGTKADASGVLQPRIFGASRTATSSATRANVMLFGRQCKATT